MNLRLFLFLKLEIIKVVAGHTIVFDFYHFTFQKFDFQKQP